MFSLWPQNKPSKIMVDVSSIPEIQESFCVQYQSEEEILIYFFNTIYLHIFHLRSNAELCFFFLSEILLYVEDSI